MKRILAGLEENYIKFDDKKISTILDNSGKLWFCGIEVAETLEYVYPKQAIQQQIDDDDKIQFRDINSDTTTKKHPQTVFINEVENESLRW